MAGKKGMTGPNMGGRREGAGRPRTQYKLVEGEMITLSHYQSDGIGVDVFRCTPEWDRERGVMRLVRSDGSWYEIGNWPQGADNGNP